MAIRVVKAVEVSAPHLSAYAAPPGFPFLLQEGVEEVVILQPPTLFLFSKFCPIHREQEKIGKHFNVVLNSAIAVANDLKDWWEFLDHAELSWRNADQEDFECYRDAMLSTISPHTNRRYQDTTVKRRLISVLQFYAWAQGKRLCPARLKKQAVVIRSFRDGQNEQIEETSKGNLRDDGLPRTSYSRWEHVRVLTPEMYQKVASHVGGLPSDTPRDGSHCQIRLGVEIAITAGLRIDEIIGLTVAQIRALGPSDGNLLSLRYLRLTRTKGSKPRKVPIPMWLISELNHYIACQRAAAQRQRRPCHQPHDNGPLLLNDAEARHNCGKPLSAQTLRRKFGLAQIRAGLVRNVSKQNPATGIQSEIQGAAFRFHDLRHTFAIWHYYAEKRAGNSEPWKRIQSILGHEYLSTTLNIYLRVAGDFEAEVSDAMSANLAAGNDMPG